MVAAFVTFKESGEKNWILSEVLKFDARTQKYIVGDVDDENRTQYKVKKRQILPLPLWRANPETDPEAFYGQQDTGKTFIFPFKFFYLLFLTLLYDAVLALYPQTTCFYKAEIISVPETAHDDYVVCFENEVYKQLVPQRYILKYTLIKSKV